ncbi:MAG: NAD-dependent epimerase/dehydratase family protein [Sphingobacteriaceae bacterium]
MNNLLISGVNGFVGTNLLAYLSEKPIKVSKISRSIPSKKTKDIPDFNWDNLAGIKAYPFKAIIHLAGKAHDLRKTSNVQEYFDVNTALTKILFDQFLLSAARDFIYLSSVKAVADTVEGELLEDVLPKPQTPYGQSKQAAEAYILNQVLPEDKRVFILRPCMIHGPGNKGNLNLLYQFVKKGLPYPFAAFENKRSFLSIGNLNYVIEQILSRPELPSGIYNLADDEALSTNNVINIISKASGAKARLWKLSPVFIKGLALIGDKLHLPINSERLKKLTESYVVSNKKIKKALNIKQFPISSGEGLAITIQSFRSN